MLPEQGHSPETLVIGVSPGQGAGTAERVQPFASYLRRSMSTPVDVRVAASYDELRAWFERGEVHAAAFNPLTYAMHGRALGAVPIAAATHGGSPTYVGYVVVRDHQRYPTLRSLRGARMAWVSRQSTSGYVYARALLRYRGIDPDGFFGDERFAGDHLAAIRLVSSGQADAAAVASAFVDRGRLERIPEADALFVIGKTERIPLDCVVVRDDLSRSLAEELQRALLTLDADAASSLALEQSWGMGGFVPPDPSRYDRVAEALAAERDQEGS